MKDFFRYDGQETVEEILTENYDNEVAPEEVDTHVVETPVAEYTPVVETHVASENFDNSSVTVYSLRDFVVAGVGPIKKGYNTISKSDHDKMKHIKAIRLARPDEVANRQK
jgi:hypothetical protein